MVVLISWGKNSPHSFAVLTRTHPSRPYYTTASLVSIEEKKQKVDKLLDNYPGLNGFYWAKEKIRGLYQQPSRGEATKLLDNIIFNLKSADDAELIRWGNTLKHWRKPILNHFDNHTTNGFTGC